MVQPYVLLALYPGVFILGLWLGVGHWRDAVRSELRSHTGPSGRTIEELPKEEVLGILNFATTGKRPSGW
jgi:hypothetical protein